MVECQFSVLLEINCKVQNIMRCLDIHPLLKREVIQENEIIQTIIGNLSRTLEGLLQRDHKEELVNEQSVKMYENMERELQRQQNLNRTLIKKELEFKEYQKCLFDQLAEQRKTVKELQTQLNKTNDKILAKDLQILQLNNEKRMSKDALKDKKSKEIFMFETLVNEKKLIDPFRNAVRDAPTAHTHQRRKSDELTKRPSTANAKKKGSIPKK